MKNNEYKLTIGLEIHAQINTKSKLFSQSKSDGCDEPNKNVSLIDLGLPGALPRLNEEIVKKAILASLALNGTINKNAKFDRKHYFYPDSPLGYQITQFFHPVCLGGYIELSNKIIHLDHFHIETDAGKMVHMNNSNSYVDFNRTGIPLIEIVTKPEIESVEEFKEFINELILRLRYIDVCDCNMELGNFRIDTNISISKDHKKLGTRVEIKNLNSVRFAIDAINYEYQRQVELINSGGNVIQETRGFNSDTGETFIMRSKEDFLDYAYMPDFNIPPMDISDELIDEVHKTLPEMPNYRRLRYEYLGESTREVLVSDIRLSDFFDEAARNLLDGNIIANLITTD
ncbi:MAG: Asp-tRNA(Asn)/Glu-tRNA(Gln) amidotransferase subunit GatB, partial [Bacteroidota bacterium]